jgi:hypothetical protein
LRRKELHGVLSHGVSQQPARGNQEHVTKGSSLQMDSFSFPRIIRTSLSELRLRTRLRRFSADLCRVMRSPISIMLFDCQSLNFGRSIDVNVNSLTQLFWLTLEYRRNDRYPIYSHSDRNLTDHIGDTAGYPIVKILRHNFRGCTD